MKRIIGFILILLIVVFGLKIVFFNDFTKQSWRDKSTIEFTDSKEDQIDIEINGEKINIKNPIYLKENRYYIPLSDIVKLKRGTIKRTKNILKISLFDRSVEVDKENWTVDNENLVLKKPIISNKKILYVSLIDFTNIFDLDSRWSYDKKTIKLYNIRDNSIFDGNYKGDGIRKGALRLEDITIDGTGSVKDSNYLEGLRLIGKSLSYKDIPYYIAWIPRYVDPSREIDLDPSKVESFPVAELVYTLDYLTYNNGFIGLHGYTHQRDKEISAIGVEFGKNYPSVEDIDTRVKKALDIADYLDIKIDFFEAPHYEITVSQNNELEGYFKYIFNNYNCEKPLSNQKKIIKSPSGNDVYYIPTPLYYVEDGTGDKIIKRIRELSRNSFAGFFYHPFIEVAQMEFTEDSLGIPLIEYNSPSTLNKIINSLQNNDIRLIRFH